MPAPNQLAMVVDSHEERIQRIEEVQPAVMVQVSQCVSEIGFTKQMLAETKDAVMTKLDSLQKTMTDHAAASATGFKDVAVVLDDQTARLEKLEADKRTKDARIGLLKKGGFGAFAIVVGALLTKFGERLWELVAG